MDRITYISRFSDNLTNDELDKIGVISEANNARDELTGILMCFEGVFYQILEGQPGSLYKCFNRIKEDPRHQDIFILDIKRNIPTRMYPRWKMKTFNLDQNNDPLVVPIRNLLGALTKTHNTLRKYAPDEVLDGIQNGLSPLDWAMERDDMVVMFSDIIGFSSLVEKAHIEEVQQVLDMYFEVALSAISRSGGTISKLLGDGFMAYYPIRMAPAALSASEHIIKTLMQKREKSQSPFQKLSYCSIGLSAGSVVKGNTGSPMKMDYTILGDVVNSASRLEGYTRGVGYAIVFDQRFKYYLPDDSFNILELGTVTPKGKTQELTIFTLDCEHVVFDKSPEEISEALMALGD